MALNNDLLEILACPTCRGSITPVDNESGLCCPTCNVVYPVREDIPIMLVEEAISRAEWERGKRSVK